MLFCAKNQGVLLFTQDKLGQSKTMATNSTAKAKKITGSLSNFFTKEEELKNKSKKMVNEIIKKSDNKKILALKNKILGK